MDQVHRQTWQMAIDMNELYIDYTTLKKYKIGSNKFFVLLKMSDIVDSIIGVDIPAFDNLECLVFTPFMQTIYYSSTATTTNSDSMLSNMMVYNNITLVFSIPAFERILANNMYPKYFETPDYYVIQDVHISEYKQMKHVTVKRRSDG